MSKSSSTNYPRGFLTKSLSHLLIVSSLTECDGSAAGEAASHGFRYTKREVLLGGYSSEVPPLPIPNREVKLTHADGTAFLGGRVGSRLFKPNPIRVRLFCVYVCGLLFAGGWERNAGGTRAAACGDREKERMRIAGLRCREAAARAVLRTAFLSLLS